MTRDRAWQPKDDPRFREVPESVAFTLRYPSGVIAHCDCSFGARESRPTASTAARGASTSTGVRLPRAAAAREPAGPTTARATRSCCSRRSTTSPPRWTTSPSACCDGHDAAHARGDGAGRMRVIEAIEEAARTGRTIDVE